MPATLNKPPAATAPEAPSRRGQPPKPSRVQRPIGDPDTQRTAARHRRHTIDEIQRQRPIDRPANYRSHSSRHPSKHAGFLRRFTLEKSFTLIGFATGLALATLFTIDLLFAWPLKKASVAFDMTFALSGFAMLLLSWDVAKDQIRN